MIFFQIISSLDPSVFPIAKEVAIETSIPIESSETPPTVSQAPPVQEGLTVESRLLKDALFWKMKFEAEKGKVVELKKEVKRLQGKVRSVKNNKPFDDKSFFSKDEQLFLKRKTMRGNTWSQEMIQKGLKLNFIAGRTGYETLKEMGYPLPARRTLQKRTESITFHTGVQYEMFQLMGTKAQALQPKDRLCGIGMDEMSLTPAKTYDIKSDSFIGDVTLPGHTGKASKALVIMLVGLQLRWKQIVCYHFTGDCINGEVFKPLLLEVITKAHEVGLKVMFNVNDMGPCNQKL